MLIEEEKIKIKYGSNYEIQEVDDQLLLDNDVVVPTLPTLKILEKDCVLLHDIQVLFNLRGDYCLALIVQQMKEEEDWVLQDPKLESLNTCFN